MMIAISGPYYTKKFSSLMSRLNVVFSDLNERDDRCLINQPINVASPCCSHVGPIIYLCHVHHTLVHASYSL